MTGQAAVTVFYDVPDWAFHNVARNVARITAGRWSVRTAGRADWFGRPREAARLARSSDILVFLWRFDLLAFLDCLDADASAYLASPDRPALVTVVFDHLYHDPESLAQIGDPFPLSDAVGACSWRLQRIYDAAHHLPNIDVVVPDGVDLSRFRPAPSPRASSATAIGWVGNSDWGATVGTDFKGKRSIFDPAMAMLAQSKLTFDRKVADRATSPVARCDMPAFYHGLDILVCTSAIEGTPNPVLEAIASGVAVITTDVGIVREALGPAQADFILSRRSPRTLASAAARLLRDPERLAALKEENLRRRDRLAWETRASLWDQLFDTALAARAAPSGVDRTAAIGRYRARHRTPLERLRRIVATSPTAYRTYRYVQQNWPGAVRRAKKMLARRAS